MEIRRKKIISRLFKHNKASTMVETLVSFTVLVIVLAALYGIVVFSTELYMKSVDTSRLQQRFYREIYKKDDKIDSSFIEKKFYVRGFGGKVDVNGTECEHAALSLVIRLDDSTFTGDPAMKNSEIELTGTDLTSYVCKDSSGIVPKVVNFEYESNH